LDIDDDAKEFVQGLGDAINAAVERSAEVADAIQNLREAGYDVELVLKLEIGLRARDEDEDELSQDADAAPLELTDEDRRTLRSMKIRFDETE
jgi:ABC-type transporter Mla subunit MlaD